MKLVLLVAHTMDGEPQHRFVAHRIAEAFPQELKAIVVATGIRRSLGARLRRIASRYSARQIASRVAVRLSHILSGRDARRRRAFDGIFFPDGGGEGWPRPDLVRYVAAHNGPECRAILDELEPDVVITYGTLIIGRSVLEKAARSTINMHTGISPTYRGSDTIFWPLHDGRPDMVGVTIHRVDPGIDSGPILHVARPTIAADDDEHTLFAKAVEVGTPLLIAAAREEFEGSSNAVEQDLSAGREFRSVERTVGAERQVGNLLAQGLLRRFAEGNGGRTDAESRADGAGSADLSSRPVAPRDRPGREEPQGSSVSQRIAR